MMLCIALLLSGLCIGCKLAHWAPSIILQIEAIITMLENPSRLILEIC